MDATDELSAPDDRTVRFRLKRPFPHLPEALAGPGGNVPAIMPERLAAESPFKPVAEIVGSGPYRFLEGRACQRRPRRLRALCASISRGRAARSGFTSGPKVAHFERVEWLTLDRVFGVGGAAPRRDRLVGDRRRAISSTRSARDRNITVVSHYATGERHHDASTSSIRRSTTRRSGGPCSARSTRPRRCRRSPAAIRNNWRDDVGLFGTGTPLASDVGIEVLRSPRDYAAVKRALAEAGYKGEKIVVIAPTDVREHRRL